MSRVQIPPPRPLTISRDFAQNFPQAEVFHPQARRKIPSIAHPMRRTPHGGQIGRRGKGGGIFGRGATDAGGAIFSAGVQRVAKRRTLTNFRGRRRVREVGACGKAAAPSGRGGLSAEVLTKAGFLARLFQRGGHPCALRLPPSVASKSPHFPPLAFVPHHAGGSGSALPPLKAPPLALTVRPCI